MPSSVTNRAARLVLTALLGAIVFGGTATFTATPAAQHRASAGTVSIEADGPAPACSACVAGF